MVGAPFARFDLALQDVGVLAQQHGQHRPGQGLVAQAVGMA